MSALDDHKLEYEDMPVKKLATKPKKEIKTMEKKIAKQSKPVAKEPKSIKLSTIWKAAVYTFAVIGVVLSVMYVNDIVNGIVDSRAEQKAQEMIKAQPVAAPQSKVNQ